MNKLSSTSLARSRHGLDSFNRLPPIVRRSALAAVAWGLLFAAIHAYWAVGGTVGLEGERVTGALLVIDLIAVPLCLLAAATAGAAVRPSLWPAPFWMLRAAAWAAGIVLGLRGLMGIAQTALGQAGDVPWAVVAADPFFLLGGLLFGTIARYYGHVARRSPGRPPVHARKASTKS